MVSDFFGVVDSVFDTVQDSLDALVGKVTGFIDDRIGDAESFISRTIDTVQASIDTTLSATQSTLGSLITRATDSIDDILDAQDDVLASFGVKISLIPDAIADGIDNVLDALQSKVVAPIDAAIDAAQERAEEVITKLGGLLTMVLETISTQLSMALEPLQQLAGDLGTSINSALTGFIPNLFEFLAPDAVKNVKGIVDAFEETPGLPADIKSITSPGELSVVGALAIGGPIIFFSAFQALTQAALGPWMLNLTASQNRKARPMRLTPGDAIRAERRGFWSGGRRQFEMEELGFPDDAQRVLGQLDTEQLAVQEVLALWLRGIIEPRELDIRLEKLGFTSPDIGSLRTLAFPIPSVQDLIRMAVREVFTPEIAEEFGQFDEIPDEYTLWTKRQGLSEFWSRNIWAAHWVLPSIQMGFEMLHRGEINEEELDNLFIAQDVMPFWRDRLAAISFKLITRVDIRRMHAADVLGDQAVFDAYKELGYNDEKASKLTELVLKITAAKRAPQADRERDLTRADIIGLFGAKLIGPIETNEALIEIGYDENEAGLILAREQIKMIVSERRSRKDLIFDKFRIGSLTFEQAQDSLVELELTSIELDQAQTDLILIRERRLSIPTKTDFDKFFIQALISSEEYDEGLRLLGFADHWILLYKGLLEALTEAEDEEEIEEPPLERDLTRTDILSLFRVNLIDRREAITSLMTLGFDEDETDLLIRREELKIANAKAKLAAQQARES